MVMSGCGGDITDLSCLRCSLITRLCLQIIIKLSPLARPDTSEEADTVRHHRVRFIRREIMIRLQEETDPARPDKTSGNKTVGLAFNKQPKEPRTLIDEER